MRNKIAKVLAGVLLLTVLGGPAWGQSRIATVDLRKVFDNYWKKKQAEAQLKERQADMQKEDKNLIAEFDRAREEYQTLLTGANEPALSTEERDKRKKAAEDKLKSLQELQVNIRQYEKTAETTILEQTDRMRSNILNDIRTVVNAKAKAGGFSMVIDTAAETINKTPVFLYSTNENDLTDAVLTQLNSNAPSEAAKTDATPAATDEKKKEGQK
ncbi:MAG TPA: OmpH family outer membrane protein [Verrucomicrobiae bacterium]